MYIHIAYTYTYTCSHTGCHKKFCYHEKKNKHFNRLKIFCFPFQVYEFSITVVVKNIDEVREYLPKTKEKEIKFEF